MNGVQWLSWKGILISVLTGVFSSAVVALGAYYILRQNISSMVADGLSILNVQATSSALGDISRSCNELTGILTQPTTRPAQEELDALRLTVKRLKETVSKVEITESYSIDEITKLANQVGMWHEKKDVIDRHVGKPKRIVKGLSQIQPMLARLEGQMESLDRQMRQDPHVDFSALRDGMARIETIAAAAQAALDSRQSATLLTLERFAKGR